MSLYPTLTELTSAKIVLSGLFVCAQTRRDSIGICNRSTPYMSVLVKMVSKINTLKSWKKNHWIRSDKRLWISSFQGMKFHGLFSKPRAPLSLRVHDSAQGGLHFLLHPAPFELTNNRVLVCIGREAWQSQSIIRQHAENQLCADRPSGRECEGAGIKHMAQECVLYFHNIFILGDPLWSVFLDLHLVILIALDSLILFDVEMTLFFHTSSYKSVVSWTNTMST